MGPFERIAARLALMSAAHRFLPGFLAQDVTIAHGRVALLRNRKLHTISACDEASITVDGVRYASPAALERDLPPRTPLPKTPEQRENESDWWEKTEPEYDLRAHEPELVRWRRITAGMYD